jgi:hypothetical protein
MVHASVHCWIEPMSVGSLIWVLIILFEGIHLPSGDTNAMAVTTGEFNTRAACERAANTARWENQHRTNLRVSFVCAAKE